MGPPAAGNTSGVPPRGAPPHPCGALRPIGVRRPRRCPVGSPSAGAPAVFLSGVRVGGPMRAPVRVEAASAGAVSLRCHRRPTGSAPSRQSMSRGAAFRAQTGAPSIGTRPRAAHRRRSRPPKVSPLRPTPSASGASAVTRAPSSLRGAPPAAVGRRRAGAVPVVFHGLRAVRRAPPSGVGAGAVPMGEPSFAGRALGASIAGHTGPRPSEAGCGRPRPGRCEVPSRRAP